MLLGFLLTHSAGIANFQWQQVFWAGWHISEGAGEKYSGRQRVGGLNAIIPTIHGTSFFGFSISTILLTFDPILLFLGSLLPPTYELLLCRALVLSVILSHISD
jgi:hypothetical protein